MLDAFFRQGRESCLLASLGIGDASRTFHPRIRQIFRAWIDVIAATLRDGGLSAAAAQARAQDAVVRIEGALVLAHSLGDTGIFARTP